MTLLPTMRETGRRVRLITDPVGSPVLEAQDVLPADASPFPCSLTPPRSSGAGDDGSPRARPALTLRWVVGFRAPSGALLRAGERVKVGLGTYELLTAPRPVRAGRRATAAEASVQDIGVLWPFEADVTKQDGTLLASNLLLAVWGGRDSNRPEGTYEDREGDAPIDAAEVLSGQNVMITLNDGQKLRVISAVVDTVGPRVLLNLRRAGG